jgi:hypothetical protein
LLLESLRDFDEGAGERGERESEGGDEKQRNENDFYVEVAMKISLFASLI